VWGSAFVFSLRLKASGLGLGFRASGLVFWSLGFGVWGTRFGALRLLCWGLGFRV